MKRKRSFKIHSFNPETRIIEVTATLTTKPCTKEELDALVVKELAGYKKGNVVAEVPFYD